jgi:hypothetical protein
LQSIDPQNSGLGQFDLGLPEGFLEATATACAYGSPAGITTYWLIVQIDTVLAEVLGEHQNAISVLRGIVAVADKNFRRIRRHFGSPNLLGRI